MESGWEPEIRLRPKAKTKLRELLPDIDADRFNELIEATEDTLSQFHWLRNPILKPSEIRQSAERVARLASELYAAVESSEIMDIIDSELRRSPSAKLRDFLQTLRALAVSAERIAAKPIPKGRPKKGARLLVDALAGIWQEYTGAQADRHTKGAPFYEFVQIVLRDFGIHIEDYRSVIQPK